MLGHAPRLECVIETDAHEGVMYVAAEDALYFTTLPRTLDAPEPGALRVAIKRLALDGDRFPLEPERLSVLRPTSNAANGMALDLEGRLFVCEQGTRSQTRRDQASGSGQRQALRRWSRAPGPPAELAQRHRRQERRQLWFTDPSYGHLQGFKPAPQLGESVYRYDPRERSPDGARRRFRQAQRPGVLRR